MVHNLIRTTKPIPLINSTSFYFEVKIIDGGKNDYLGIGITEADPNTRSGSFPGWDTFPTLGIGYHGDDGKIFHKNGYTKSDFVEKFTTGDVVGCLIYLARTKDNEINLVQFTKNGKKLNFPRVVKTKVWYPTIGISSPGASVDTNFGQHPFLYLREGNYIEEIVLFH